jgi:hypothetical protein
MQTNLIFASRPHGTFAPRVARGTSLIQADRDEDYRFDSGFAMDGICECEKAGSATSRKESVLDLKLA